MSGRSTYGPVTSIRAPNKVRTGTFEDKPEAHFTYPNAPAGYPPHEYTFTTDQHGFRNKQNYESCDVVVPGGSFAEGSGVSDEQVWPVLLGRKRGWAVYNLGMSGTSIAGYHDVMERFGSQPEPKIVLCLLYEGNDFRDHNLRYADVRRKSVKDIVFRASPIRQRLKNLMIRYLGPINANRFDDDGQKLNNPAHVMYPVVWLPMNFPVRSGNSYTFDLKRMLAHCKTPAQFAQTAGYRGTCKYITELKQECAARNVRFIVIYAQNKPHLLLRANRNNIDAAGLGAFASLHKKNPPPKERILEEYVEQMDSFEIAMADFCRQHDIEFISLTEVFLEKMASGTRAYFTYDQHRSPEGHQIAADFLADQLE